MMAHAPDTPETPDSADTPEGQGKGSAAPETPLGIAGATPAEVAEAVRQACLEAALEGYEAAGMSGLCHEGRWECAVDAIRSLDLHRWQAAPASPASGDA